MVSRAPGSGSRSQRSAIARTVVVSPMRPSANAASRRTEAERSPSAAISARTVERSWIKPSARAAAAPRSRSVPPRSPTREPRGGRPGPRPPRARGSPSSDRAPFLGEQGQGGFQHVAGLDRLQLPIRGAHAPHAAPDGPPFGRIRPSVDSDRSTPRRAGEVQRPRVVSYIEARAGETRGEHGDRFTAYDRELHSEGSCRGLDRTSVLRPPEPPDGKPSSGQLAGDGGESLRGPPILALPRAGMDVDRALGRARAQCGIGN